MNIRTFTVLGLCQILSLVFSLTTWATESTTSEQYHYRVTYADHTWTYRSYGNDALLKEEKDLNQDGQIDYTLEIIRIKNVTIETQDQDFDGKLDKIVFSYTKRKYILTDDDRDKIFDHLTITDDLNSHIAVKFIAKIPQEISPALLVDILDWYDLDDEKFYVLSENTQKYANLQTMLNKVRREAPQDVARWEELFNKTREYLDLPSNDVLPIVFKLREPEPIENFIQGQAEMKYLHHFFVDATAFKDIDMWLATVDHEMVHAIQNKRMFEYLNKNSNITWADFMQYADDHVNKVDRGYWYRWFQCPISDKFFVAYSDFFVINLYFLELEAYTHTFKRGQYHNLLCSHHQRTDSDQAFTGAYMETIKEGNLTPPVFLNYLTTEAQKISAELANVPQARIERLKQHIKEKIGK